VGLSAELSGQEKRSGYADVRVPCLYYETAGQGTPVVLIHGGQMDRRMWDRQFAELAKNYQAIRYDVRGYGKSDSPTRPYADEEDLESLLDYLKVDKVHLVGLSLGGRISIDFALRYPQRVRSLVLVGPGLSGFQWSKEAEKSFAEMLHVIQMQGPDKAAEMWLRDPYMAPAMKNPAIAPRLRELALDNTRAWLMNDALGRWLEPRAATRLKDIKGPTLVVVGDQDVPDIQQIVKKIAAEVPSAKKLTIAGAGHIVNMEKPEEFDRALFDWLKAHE
jgi:pimeloyl-ACP methyl ester carboxylesterase